MNRDQVLADQTEKNVPQSTAARVYYSLAGTRFTPFEPSRGSSASKRTVELHSVPAATQALAAHRTRKALGVVLEKLIARGVLTKEDVDDILLAAVDYMGPGASQGPRG